MTITTTPLSRLLIHLILVGCLLTTGCAHPVPLAQDEDTPSQSQSSGQNQKLEGKVIRILDGDTIEILIAKNSTFRIRLQGIDAPEKSQAYGTKARQQLAEFIFNKHVTVEWEENDRYGRVIGKIMSNNQDINLRMVQTGCAWHFKRYQMTQSEPDRIAYGQAEDKSRQQKLGLWADLNPIPPWTYRGQK